MIIFHNLLLMEKNPAPVDMVNIPLFAGFHTCQVVQDFFHQQYDSVGHDFFGTLSRISRFQRSP